MAKVEYVYAVLTMRMSLWVSVVLVGLPVHFVYLVFLDNSLAVNSVVVDFITIFVFFSLIFYSLFVDQFDIYLLLVQSKSLIFTPDANVDFSY